MSGQPDPIPVGTRVRHRGEQYPEALGYGTGNIVEVIRYYPVDRTYEYLVQCDKAPWGGSETLVERNHIVAIDPAYAAIREWANQILPKGREIRSRTDREDYP